MGDELADVDLFGEPVGEPVDPRGRPKHRVTMENRSKVSALRASGMSRDDIAAVIEVSLPTLAKYYFAELNAGVARERAAAVMLLRTSAYSGNVTAQKAWLRLLADGQAVPPVAEPADPEMELGKKERALRAAQAGPAAGSSWGDLVRH